jgi:hypothetical protein
MKKVIFISIVTLALASCSVTKRVHNSGFHIQWKSTPKNEVAHDKNEMIYAIQEEEVTQNEDEIDAESMIPLITQTIANKTDVLDEINEAEKPSISSHIVVIQTKIEGKEVVQKSRNNAIKNIEKQLIEKKKRKVEIDWTTVFLVFLVIAIVVLVLLVLFATPLLAKIAAVALAIIGIILIVLALYLMFLIGWLIWLLLFSWWV